MTADFAAPIEGDRRPWIAVRVEGAADPAAVARALFEAGSLGVQEDGPALVTHFPPDHDIALVRAALTTAAPDATVSVSEAPATDWSEWRASVRAHRLGSLTIAPPWLADESDDSLVIIDPAMAFGTGEHPTTRGVVRLMQELPSMPETVADLGAGSAVLAICAAKLGASRVVAVELDHDAIENAEDNVRVNAVADRVHVIEGDASLLLPLIAPVELIVANIISSVLLELLPVIHDSVTAEGHAILSGILVEEREMILAAATVGWIVLAEDTEEGWWSVLIKRRP